MTAKEYLSKIQTYRHSLADLETRIEELYTKAQGLKAITYDKDRVQVSHGNTFEDKMILLDSEADKWIQMRAKYERELRIRKKRIDELEKPLHSELLKLMYVEGLSLRMATAKIQIAHPERKYSEEYMRQVHGWALDAFDKKYKISPKYNQI